VYLKAAILNAKGVEITLARFLNPDPEARSLKLASSVVVTTCPEDGKRMGTNIFLLSRKKRGRNRPLRQQNYSLPRLSEIRTHGPRLQIRSPCLLDLRPPPS